MMYFPESTKSEREHRSTAVPSLSDRASRSGGLLPRRVTNALTSELVGPSPTRLPPGRGEHLRDLHPPGPRKQNSERSFAGNGRRVPAWRGVRDPECHAWIEKWHQAADLERGLPPQTHRSGARLWPDRRGNPKLPTGHEFPPRSPFPT